MAAILQKIFLWLKYEYLKSYILIEQNKYMNEFPVLYIKILSYSIQDYI
jgi:hypothetical protein